MAKKRATSNREPVTITGQDYQHMVDTMVTLSMRGYKEEDLVMRVAKAGQIEEVTKHILNMRKYAKKHQRPTSQSSGNAAPRRTRKSKKHATPATPPAE